MGSNWKRSFVLKDPGKPARKKRISPSKARRNASRLQAFLVKKNVESHDTPEVFDSSTQASQSLDSGKYVDSHVSQQCRPDSREEDRGSDERNEHVVVEGDGDDINSRDKRISEDNASESESDEYCSDEDVRLGGWEHVTLLDSGSFLCGQTSYVNCVHNVFLFLFLFYCYTLATHTF